MLPGDAKKRRQTTVEDNLRQSQVHDHFAKAAPEDVPIRFTNELLKEAAIDWLIQTNQVRMSSLIGDSALISYNFLLPATPSLRTPLIQEND